MKADFVIESKNAPHLYDALLAEKSFTSRSRVELSLKGDTLNIRIEAKDFNALRSASTSYLRMLAAAKETLEVLK